MLSIWASADATTECPVEPVTIFTPALPIRFLSLLSMFQRKQASLQKCFLDMEALETRSLTASSSRKAVFCFHGRMPTAGHVDKSFFDASSKRCGGGIPKSVCAALHASRCNEDIGVRTLAPRLCVRTAVNGFVMNDMVRPRDAQPYYSYYTRCYGAGSPLSLRNMRLVDLWKITAPCTQPK